MIIDCISDLHGHYPELEGGDLLIVAGDLTNTDKEEEIEFFFKWLHNNPYNKKIVIGGNHDNLLQTYKNEFMNLHCSESEITNIEYLCDSGTKFEGIKIWGTPWTKTFKDMNPKCKAFTCDTEEELAIKFSLIPDDIDILITHGPPYGIFDCVRRFPNDIPERTGSQYLSDKIRGNTNLKLHVFGHIHEHGGKTIQYGTTTTMVNASIMNEFYEPVNKPVRILL